MSKRRAGRARPAIVAAVEPSDEWLIFAGQLLVIGKIAVALLVFDALAFDAFALPKAAFGHALTFVLVAVLLLLLLRYGSGIVPRTRLHFAVGTLVGLFALATIFALDRTVALFGMDRRLLGLTQMLDNAVLFVATAILFRSRRDVTRLALGLGAATVLIVLYSAAQSQGIDIAEYREEARRPLATFGNPAIAGAFLAIAAATALAVATSPLLSFRAPARAGIAALGVVSFVLLLSTGERAGLIALVTALAMSVALVGFQRRMTRRQLGIAAGIPIAVLAVSIWLSPVGARLGAVTLDDPGVLSRVDIWQAAVRSLTDRPILGLGPDNFGVAYLPLRLERAALGQGATVTQTSTHNWLLYAATSAGVPAGVVISVIALGGVVLSLGLARRADPAALVGIPLVAYLGQGLVNVNDVSLEWIPWVTVGTLVGASQPALPLQLRRRLFISLTPASGAAVVLLGCFASGLYGYQAVRPAEAMLVSEAASTAGAGDVAVERATAALRMDPRRATYWASLGTAFTAAKQPFRGTAAFAEAAQLQPGQSLYWYDIGLVRLLAVGDDVTARVALMRAIKENPYDRDSWDLLSRISVNRGEFVRAREEGLRAVSLEPLDGKTYEAPIIADIRLGNWEEADAIATQARARLDTQRLRVLHAEVLAGLGRRDDALALVNLVLTNDPNDAEAEALLARLQAGR